MLGDVRSSTDVRKALTGQGAVIHVASYGMSGKEQLNYPLIEAVNVQVRSFPSRRRGAWLDRFPIPTPRNKLGGANRAWRT